MPHDLRMRKGSRAAFAANMLSCLYPRAKGIEPKLPRRIGVLAQWGIGDAVLLLPLLRGLKQAYPDASLELIGKPWLSELLDGEGCCDRTHRLVPPWTAYGNKYLNREAWLSFLAELREVRGDRFDWLIGPSFDPREVLQLRLLRSRRTFGFGAAGGYRWITDDLRLTQEQYYALHRAAVSLEILRAIAPAEPATTPFFRRRPQAEERIRQWLRTKGHSKGPVLAVHAGAGSPIRHWREPHFASVIKALPAKPGMIVFVDVDDNGGSVDWLSSPYVPWRGDLRELKALLSVCDVFLGTDSGVMHMATAAGCEVVAAFGPGEPRWFRPYGENHEVAIVEPMPCRPCLDACIHSRPLCLDRLEDRVLVKALQRKLAEAQRSLVQTGAVSAVPHAVEAVGIQAI
jgi:ADP-heptose:LPS heptosyltransferase